MQIAASVTTCTPACCACGKPPGVPRVLRDRRPQRHLLGVTLGCSLAGPALRLMAPHDMLRSLTTGLHMDRIIDALAAGHNAAMQIIETFAISVHQQASNSGANIPPKRNRRGLIRISAYLYRAFILIKRPQQDQAMSACRDPI